jgi:hypothetical protein
MSGTGNVANTAVTSAGGIANNVSESVAWLITRFPQRLAQGTVGVVGTSWRDDQRVRDVTTSEICWWIVNTTVGAMSDVIENSRQP